MSMNVAIIISVLLVMGAVAALLFWWALVYRPHPRIEGRVRVPGLHTEAEVLRDRWGVPHIYAETAADVWFAQGYVQAQDRLWQMEMYRRVAAGRMSEAVGEEGIALDRFARVIGFRRTAERQLDALDADAANALDRFAAGVNALIQQNWRRLPLEFNVLGVKPEPWTATDTLSIGLLLGWALSGNWVEELARVGVFTRLGAERAAELLPAVPAGNPAILPGEISAEQSARLLDALQSLAHYLGLTASGQGSNSWVVAGGRTVSGKPVLANDPHLSVTMPGLWHLAHLHSADGDVHVVGGGFPGAPGIVVGHNEQIAWGITAAYADTADLFVEEQHPQDPTRFRFGDAWEQAETREEHIVVRGRPDPIVLTVTTTRHGPLLNPILAEHETNLPPLALRWAGHEPRTAINGWLGILRARDWPTFRAAAAQLTTPTLNITYADRAGNIGYLTAGLVPIRAQGHGLVPASGAAGTHEWTGFIPADELPRSFNPENGELLSANNRIAPQEYPHWLGVDHDPGYRARRIKELLGARPRLSSRDYQTMQLDTFNYLGRAIAPYFTLIDPSDPWERRAQQALLEWNYRMDKDSTAALTFELVLIHLLQLVFADKLGPAAQDYLSAPRLRELGGTLIVFQLAARLAELLEQPESWWFGQGSTGEPRTREALLALALKRAVESMKAEIGDDARRWQWGRLHQIRWVHPLGGVRFLRGLLNRGPFPVAGSGVTINAQHIEARLPLRTIHIAPTFRMVADLDNWDRSTFIASPGQSGLPGHRFYANLMHIWLEGDSIPMTFSRAKVEQSDPLYRLRLLPGE